MNTEIPQRELGLSFNDPNLLQTALTHRSYLNEVPNPDLRDNERLEFLGDAVLDFISGEYLYHHFPDVKEGELTSLRSALVRTEMLANFAGRINLGSFLLMGKGEEETGGRERPAILCGAFEALIGALYLDHGLDVVREFVTPFIEAEIGTILRTKSHHDAKSKFQELAQSFYKITPRYKTIAEDGPDHNKTFTVAVYLNDVEYGRGKGSNKQRAAQAAARAALNRLNAEMGKEE